MITKENKIEKICSFYASDYHLEMIMIPYINRKIDDKSNIFIVTENSLTDTVKTVISRINLPQKRKQEILDINWENGLIENIKYTNKDNELIIFVIGNVNFINKTDKQIEATIKSDKMKIINCFNIGEVQSSITEIVINHCKVLNTKEEKEIN